MTKIVSLIHTLEKTTFFSKISLLIINKNTAKIVKNKVASKPFHILKVR